MCIYIYTVTLTIASFFDSKNSVSPVQSSWPKVRIDDVLGLLVRLTISFSRIEMRPSMGKYPVIVTIAQYLYLVIWICSFTESVLFH